MINKLCTDCPKTFDHKEHQRCYSCGGRVPVPLNSGAFANSTLCPNCFKKQYLYDEHGNLVIKV